MFFNENCYIKYHLTPAYRRITQELRANNKNQELHTPQEYYCCPTRSQLKVSEAEVVLVLIVAQFRPLFWNVRVNMYIAVHMRQILQR